jgi:hypothetical protein
MKTRFSVKEIFHIFAAQKQGEGATQKSNGGGNWGGYSNPWGSANGVPFVSFSGNVLSSYRAPIARIVPDVTDKEGRGVALVTSQKYTVTTSGHVSAAKSALSHLAVFVVPDVLAKYAYEHEKNIAHLVAEYQAELARDLRARNLPYWLSDGEARNRYAHLAEMIKAYAGLFGVNLFETQAQWAQGDFREHTRALIAAHRARDTPEAIARREKTKAKQAQQAQAKEAQQAQERAGRIEAWRNGGASLWRADLDAMPCALLRIVGDTLQTSHGARVPLRDAKRLFALISQNMRPHGFRLGAFPNGFRVGVYELSRIEENGDFRVGCHTIEYQEAARLAAEIGFNPMQEAPQGWGVIEA